MSPNVCQPLVYFPMKVDCTKLVHVQEVNRLSYNQSIPHSTGGELSYMVG